ncbi:MAG: hypothetical protein RIE86_20705, partial [Imperialibacter sp.]|uniref:hypothetical protein n=1 Tax=Imperialibacter sp. TaxID=2038411 RepID=UPI0032EC20A7
MNYLSKYFLSATVSLSFFFLMALQGCDKEPGPVNYPTLEEHKAAIQKAMSSEFIIAHVQMMVLRELIEVVDSSYVAFTYPPNLLSYTGDCVSKDYNFSSNRITLDFGDGCMSEGISRSGKLYIDNIDADTMLYSTFSISSSDLKIGEVDVEIKYTSHFVPKDPLSFGQDFYIDDMSFEVFNIGSDTFELLAEPFQLTRIYVRFIMSNQGPSGNLPSYWYVNGLSFKPYSITTAENFFSFQILPLNNLSYNCPIYSVIEAFSLEINYTVRGYSFAVELVESGCSLTLV